MLLLKHFSYCITVLSFSCFSVWDTLVSSINSENLEKTEHFALKCALVNGTVTICLFSQHLTFHPFQLVALFLNHVFFIKLLTNSFTFFLVLTSTNFLQIMVLITFILSPFPFLFLAHLLPSVLSLWNSLPYHVKCSLSLITFKCKVNILIH